MDDTDGWSGLADAWARPWGGFTRPAQLALVDAAGIGPGTRAVDVGCGSGEFLALLRDRGADAEGVDPARGMRRIAAASGFAVRDGDAEHLPFADGSVDVVTAVNALTLSDSIPAALAEFTRVLAPGGRVAVAEWAEGSRNDVDVVARAVADADQTEPPVDPPLRRPGGTESALRQAGLEPTASGIVDAPWRAVDDDALVSGLLLGEDAAFLAEMRPVVLAAAAPFRDGRGYLLRNALRWAVAIRP